MLVLHGEAGRRDKELVQLLATKAATGRPEAGQLDNAVNAAKLIKASGALAERCQ